MTGLDGRRVYLDWNATAPLRAEARAAMLAAMDVAGNPSSVHAEGRAAKAIVEKARGQVAALVGCEPDEVVFTSGATEAAAMAARKWPGLLASELEHDCLWERASGSLQVSETGRIILEGFGSGDLVAFQAANSETGIRQDLSELQDTLISVVDMAQSAGRGERPFSDLEAMYVLLSSEKLGGPGGVGALIHDAGYGAMLAPESPGGGQERGRRSGTENVIGIAGFGAAAEAARRELEENVWDRVEKLRNILEDRLADVARETIFFGQESPRLPNTTCFAVPGWAGETQVMAMDLAGFAVSAGSACSSGKVKRASRVLKAMGHDDVTASSAIRVSMGPTTTEAEVMAFADAWEAAYRRRRARAA